MPQSFQPVGVDLFCGAGGMSLGFEQAGVNVAAAVEIDPLHLSIHSQNFPGCVNICADISKISGRDLQKKADLKNKQIDILFGGSPCQGFSYIGKRQLDDPRNRLLFEFARLVSELQPSYFVLENVDALLEGEARPFYFEGFRLLIEDADYKIVEPVQVLNASSFGVPQRRKRSFILGYRKGLKAPGYPIVEVGMLTTVWDAIGDLPIIERYPELLVADVFKGKLGKASPYAKWLRSETRDIHVLSPLRDKKKGLSGCLRTTHTEYVKQRFEATPPGSYEKVTRFYRLQKGGVAPTLRAGTDTSRGSHTAARPIHPVYPRCITVREAARLHSFPDWFDFHPTRWHGFQQVGNSVPPLMARAVAESVLVALADSYGSDITKVL